MFVCLARMVPYVATPFRRAFLFRVAVPDPRRHERPASIAAEKGGLGGMIRHGNPPQPRWGSDGPDACLKRSSQDGLGPSMRPCRAFFEKEAERLARLLDGAG